ncbi:MAG: hypothetical protein RLW62_06635 [Gammaproteobacteria bacterium]
MQNEEASGIETAAAVSIERERAALCLRQRPTLRVGNLTLQLICVVLLWPLGAHGPLVVWVLLNVGV